MRSAGAVCGVTICPPTVAKELGSFGYFFSHQRSFLRNRPPGVQSPPPTSPRRVVEEQITQSRSISTHRHTTVWVHRARLCSRSRTTILGIARNAHKNERNKIFVRLGFAQVLLRACDTKRAKGPARRGSLTEETGARDHVGFFRSTCCLALARMRRNHFLRSSFGQAGREASDGVATVGSSARDVLASEGERHPSVCRRCADDPSG